MALQDHDTIEVQNQLGHKTPNKVLFKITEQLLVVKELETKT